MNTSTTCPQLAIRRAAGDSLSPYGKLTKRRRELGVAGSETEPYNRRWNGATPMRSIGLTAHTVDDTEVLVVGGGIAGVSAALAARAAGRRVTIATAGVTLLDEVTLCLHGELLPAAGAALSSVTARVAAQGGLRDDWADPAITEMVVCRRMAELGINVRYYAVPIALVEDRGALGVLFGEKQGSGIISAGAVVDATPNGALFRASGVPFHDPATITAARTIYLQFAADRVEVPPTAAGHALTGRLTWPREACLTFAAEAAFDGLPVPAALHRAARLELADIVAAARGGSGLEEAVVSHTGHCLLPLNGPRLAQPDAHHPHHANVFGAGGWVVGDYADPEGIAAAGAEVGAAAARAVTPPGDCRATIETTETDRTDVIVVGGGTGGAIAALAAARQGAGTVLVEAGWFLGGIGTGGGIHYYYHGVRGGLQDEVDERTRALAEPLGGMAHMSGFNPEAKKIALEQMLAEAGVVVRYGATMIGALSAAGRLEGVLLAHPGRLATLTGPVTVDATGDGDVAEFAGADFTLGRQADRINHTYTQSAGCLRGDKVGHHNFDAGYVDPTDVVDLTRARRHGIQLYWRDEGWTPETRLLYLAPHLGIRQGRHVVGDYTLTLADQVAGREFDDAVAYGACHYDNHANDYENESDEALFWCWFLGHWRRHMRHGVPYRCLLPAGIDGLLIGCRALSVSHDAHMLFRMQRDMQRVGEAAGTAAGLAAIAGVSPRELGAAQVQAALRATGALLDDWHSELPEATPEELCAALSGDDPTLAAWRLYALGDSSVPALLTALASDSDTVRWLAAGALAMLGRPEAVEPLLEALESRAEWQPLSPGGEDQPVIRAAPRWVAAMALLGRLGDPRAVPAVVAVLDEETLPADVLITAVRALGRIGDPAAVLVLERLLESETLPIAAETTTFLGGQGRIPEDTDWQVRLAIVDALSRLGVAADEVAEEYLEDERSYVRRYAGMLLHQAPGDRVTATTESIDTELRGRAG